MLSRESSKPIEPLVDGCENANVSVGVALALGTRTVIAEERFDPVDSVKLDDQCRAVSVAVVDHNREFVEVIRVSVCLELLGDTLYRERGPSAAQRALRHENPQTTAKAYQHIDAGDLAEDVSDVFEDE
ncbi:MAG TPA: hypothetical protein VFJ06_06225 [Halococcus sp.]|nr:hypothetical protein [Halococcus sp.]